MDVETKFTYHNIVVMHLCNLARESIKITEHASLFCFCYVYKDYKILTRHFESKEDS